jgi:hypothetical protein
MTISRGRAWLCVCLLSLTAGCGKERYEQRFEETKHYFAHLDTLNQQLSPTWHGQSVEMRVPKPFQPIAGRPKRTSSAEDAEGDPRQPTFAKVELAGLQGAWQCDISPGAGKEAAKGYLYVLSNYELLGKKGEAEKAAGFNNDVVRTIATALQQPVPDVGKLPSSEFPPGEAYVEKRKFRMVKPGFPAIIDDKDYRVQIYSYWKEATAASPEKSSAQVSLVLVIPVDAPTDKITKALDASLETLRVTKDRPPAAGPGGGARTAPAPRI